MPRSMYPLTFPYCVSVTAMLSPTSRICPSCPCPVGPCPLGSLGAAARVVPRAMPAEPVPSVCTNRRLLDFMVFQILLTATANSERPLGASRQESVYIRTPFARVQGIRKRDFFQRHEINTIDCFGRLYETNPINWQDGRGGRHSPGARDWYYEIGSATGRRRANGRGRIYGP